MPPICWGAADTEGAESAGALPPGRGIKVMYEDREWMEEVDTKGVWYENISRWVRGDRKRGKKYLIMSNMGEIIGLIKGKRLQKKKKSLDKTTT